MKRRRRCGKAKASTRTAVRGRTTRARCAKDSEDEIIDWDDNEWDIGIPLRELMWY